MSENQPNPKRIGDYYDRRADFWSTVWGHNLHVGYWESEADEVSITEAQDRLTDMLIERLQVSPRQRVLDVGCGAGGPAVRLARKSGCAVVGITLSPRQVEQGTELARANGLSDRVQFRHANAMRMPFPDETFDAAMAFESLFHTSHVQAIAEIHRVLRPGGRLVLTDLTVKRINPEKLPFEPLTKPEQVAMLKTFDTADIWLLPEHYPILLRAAGFAVEEFVDISDNQAKTMEITADMVQQRRNELLATYEPELVETMVMAWQAFARVYRHTNGYVLAVARKPSTVASRSSREVFQ